MKKIAALLTTLSVYGALMAQSPVPPKAADVKKEAATLTVANDIKPAVQADDALGLAETEHNFGKIPQGKPVTHIFKVTNTGKDSLRISNVQASCGCTTPEWEHDKAIAPGASTQITVGYNAAAEGPFNKVVTITYNGAQSKQVFIKGEVWKTPAESAPANKSLEGLKN